MNALAFNEKLRRFTEDQPMTIIPIHTFGTAYNTPVPDECSIMHRAGYLAGRKNARPNPISMEYHLYAKGYYAGQDARLLVQVTAVAGLLTVAAAMFSYWIVPLIL